MPLLYLVFVLCEYLGSTLGALVSTPSTSRVPHAPCVGVRESVAVHADEWMKRPPKSALALPACMMRRECGRPTSRTHSTQVLSDP